MATAGIFRGAVAPYIFAANQNADRLTRIAQGLLCLPSLLSSFINPVKTNSGLQANQAELRSIVTDIVRNTITSEANRLRGYVNYFIDDKKRLKKEVSTAASRLVTAKDNFKQGIDNAIDFARSQENCTYAASEMLSCIIQNSKSNITNSIASGIRGELSPIITSVGDKLSSVDGSINNYINRNADEAKSYQEAISFIKLLS